MILIYIMLKFDEYSGNRTREMKPGPWNLRNEWAMLELNLYL